MLRMTHFEDIQSGAGERISGGGMKRLLEWSLQKTWRYYKEGLEHREERGLDKGI